MNNRGAAIAQCVIATAVALLIGWAAGDGGEEVAGLPVSLWCVIAAFAVNWIVCIPSWAARTEVYFDLTGALTYFTVTALALFLGGADAATSWILAVLIWIWCARLGSFLFQRIRADGKDGRFDKLKLDFVLFFRTWTLQGLWVSLTACAAWAAMTSLDEHGIGVLVIIGLVVWVAGFGIEVKADTEKSAFKADPANAGRFISTGIWAWSRHPNYFGEITLWVGIALIALPGLNGWQYVTLVSPVFVWLLLTRISGVPLLERRGLKRWGDDPAYQAYLESTPELMMRRPRPI